MAAGSADSSGPLALGGVACRSLAVVVVAAAVVALLSSLSLSLLRGRCQCSRGVVVVSEPQAMKMLVGADDGCGVGDGRWLARADTGTSLQINCPFFLSGYCHKRGDAV